MHRLDPLVAGQIRAREIVDRPAGVARELLDNALDAGATQIAVSVAGGGLLEVAVADNGCGIAADEVAVAFAWHTTTKASASGAAYVAPTTLGFRGEALAAIAAVAQVICVTRSIGDAQAVELRVAGGELQSSIVAAREYGTTVSVRNLFYNVPERRAFLRSDQAETAELATMVTQYAVAHPGVRFTFVVDGRKRWEAGGAGSLRATMANLYGNDVAHALLTLAADAMQPVDDADGAAPAGWVSVAGLISPPAQSRDSRAFFVSVNGRPIQPDRYLRAILGEAYYTLLPHDRYPIVALHVEVPVWSVDVSGHPAKTRVRFRDRSFVGRQIALALHAALLDATPPRWQRRGQSAPPPDQAARQTDWSFERPESDEALAPAADDTPRDRSGGPNALDLTLLRPLGQLWQRYIIAESSVGLVLVDQHAAHARIRYEQLREQFMRGSVPRASLEIGREIVMPPAAHALLIAHAEPLARWGFRFDDYGLSLRVLATPRGLRLEHLSAALLDVADLLSGRVARTPEDVLEALLTTLADASAIGAESLQPEQMRALLEQLARCKEPWSCPRGCPVIRLKGIQHIEALFDDP